MAQLSSNSELKPLCTILGLEFDRTFDTVEARRRLWYGRIVDHIDVIDTYIEGYLEGANVGERMLVESSPLFKEASPSILMPAEESGPPWNQTLLTIGMPG